jgi:hypothetical protein
MPHSYIARSDEGHPYDRSQLTVADKLPTIPYPLFFWAGTLAPFLRASESPMAIACLLLVTFLLLLPLRKVPAFFLCMALSTELSAALPYFAIP